MEAIKPKIKPYSSKFNRPQIMRGSATSSLTGSVKDIKKDDDTAPAITSGSKLSVKIIENEMNKMAIGIIGEEVPV